MPSPHGRAEVPPRLAPERQTAKPHAHRAETPTPPGTDHATGESHGDDALRPSLATAASAPVEVHGGGDARRRSPTRIVGPLGEVKVTGSGDAAVAALATAQHGVVSRAQLETVGLGRGAISRRVAAGRLHRLHRGVYAVGHTALRPLAQETAALLACGSTAVISHRSAALLWGLLPIYDGPVDVTAAGRDCRSRVGIRAHTSVHLPREDRARRKGLPVTTPERTLVDVAPGLEAGVLERAFEEAIVQRLTDHAGVAAVLHRRPGRPGSSALRDLLGRLEGPQLTRSEAEKRMLGLVRAAALPAPQTNVRIGPYEVDAVWNEQRVIVEVDGYAFHSSRAAFERDRARDADLQARGFRVVRVTWRQIVDRPEATIARIARLLGPS